MTSLSEETVEAARQLKSLAAAASEQSDRERDIPQDLVRRMADAGIFGMGVPAAYGGSAADLITKMTVIEEISAGNGSAGWITMIGIGAGAFTAPLDSSAGAKLFEFGTDAPLAGAVAPAGRAVAVEGGFRLTGRWQFASGCAHARWMFAGFIPEDATSDIPPPARLALIPKEQVRIIDTWYSVGLRGTGSQDFEVEDLFVPTEFCPAASSEPRQPDVLFRLPTRMIIAVEHTAHALGMARGALAAFIELCSTKVSRPSGAAFGARAYAQEAVGRGEAKLAAARGDAFQAARWAWSRAEANEATTLNERARYRLAMLNAALAAGEVIDSLYYAAGSEALFDTSPLGRFFRDWHTASQHVFVSPSNYALAGRVLLGSEPPPAGW